MAQTNAAVNVTLAVELEPTQATPKVSSDETFTLATTVGNYTNVTAAFGTTVWNYISGSGGVFHQVNYLITVQNVTGPEPPYSQQPAGLELENRTDGILGHDDIANATDLTNALNTAIAGAVAKTNY